MIKFRQFIAEQEQVWRFGGFRVSSEIPNLSKGEWDVLTKAVQSVVAQLKKAGFSEVVNGDITVGYTGDYMPEQKRQRVVYGAVYVEKLDRIVVFQHYLRDAKSLTNLLLHEIGHKHWHKYLKSDKKKYWQSQYSSEREAREEYADAFLDYVVGGIARGPMKRRGRGVVRAVTFDELMKA